MKVCVLCQALPPYYGGAERRAYRHVQQLNRRADIEACLIGWNRTWDCSNDHFPPYVYPVQLLFEPASRGHGLAKLPNTIVHMGEITTRLSRKLFLLRHQFDLLHIINAAPLFNLLSIPLAKAINKPVILEMTLLGSDDPLNLNRRRQQPKQQLFSHRPLKYSLFLKADAYISKSQGLSEAYRQAGLPDSKLFQIPSGVDVQKFHPPTIEQKQRVRRKLGLEPEQTIILFVGGIEERKGVHRLLIAFGYLASRYPQTELLLVGPHSSLDPTYVQRLQEKITHQGLTERVTFTHAVVENVDEYMQAADIFVLPSRREGLSVAILEAMSSGLAIIASNIPEVAGCQIEPDREGLLVSVDGTEELTTALRTLLDNPALGQRLGQAARKRVLREFSHQIVNQQYLDLYHALLQKKPFVLQPSH